MQVLLYCFLEQLTALGILNLEMLAVDAMKYIKKICGLPVYYIFS